VGGINLAAALVAENTLERAIPLLEDLAREARKTDALLIFEKPRLSSGAGRRFGIAIIIRRS
jgi:hypothetical protein